MINYGHHNHYQQTWIDTTQAETCTELFHMNVTRILIVFVQISLIYFEQLCQFYLSRLSLLCVVLMISVVCLHLLAFSMTQQCDC